MPFTQKKQRKRQHPVGIRESMEGACLRGRNNMTSKASTPCAGTLRARRRLLDDSENMRAIDGAFVGVKEP